MLMETFKYYSLAGSDHIRLLRVEHRPTEDGPLQIYTIIERRLADAPPFQTVSYVWGDSRFRWPLELSNGSVICVNDSIHTGLPYLVAQCTSGYLWIDQICIDQRNLSEPSEQVAIMGEIYARAENCLVWLGVGTDSTREIIREMVEIAGCGTQNYRLKREVSPRDLGVDAWILDRKEYVTEAMIELFSFPWFTRVWILQEAIRAQRIRMLISSDVWAPSQIHFLFIRASNLLYCRWYDEPDTTAAGLRPWDFLMEEYSSQQTFYQSLYGMLTRFRAPPANGLNGNFKASDPRDYVFAILGICHDSNKSSIAVDYSLPTSTVVTSATRAIIASSGTLDCLFLGDGLNRGLFSNRIGIQGMPTWVPDWSELCDFLPMRRVDSRIPGDPSKRLLHPYDASAGRAHHTRLEDLPFELTVRGKALGTVEEILDGFKFEDLFACFSTVFHPEACRTFYLGCIRRLRMGLGGRVPQPFDELRVIKLLFSLHLLSMPWSSNFREAEEHLDKLLYLYGQERSLLVEAESEGLIHPSREDCGVNDFERLEIDGLPGWKSESHTWSCPHGVPEPKCRRGECTTKCEQQALAKLYEFTIRDRQILNRFFLSSEGVLGLQREGMMTGDVIAILHGHTVPVLLRRIGESGGMYQYVGSCIFEGAMHGEAVIWEEEDADTFRLV